MSSTVDLVSCLDFAAQKIQESQDSLASLRARVTEECGSPELIAYLDGLQNLINVTANATRDIANGLRQDFGRRPSIDEYQY